MTGMLTPTPRGAWLQAAVAIPVCMASVGLFFRYQILSGFGHTFGDIVDGRIEIALLEHWYNTFRGLEAWRQPIFFFPTPDVLGYNDGYLILGTIYAVLRAAGFDPFLATDLLNAVMRVIAYTGYLLFARRACDVSPGWAIVGAAMFTLSNGAYMQTAHAQLLTVAFTPLLGWMLWIAGEAWLRHEARRAAFWGCAASVLFDAWLLTAFYTAWFTALFALIMALVCLPALRPLDRLTWLRWRRLPWWPAATVVAVLVAGTAPFLRTYLPTLRMTGAHDVAQALALVPAPSDLINTGPDNLFYGPLNQWLQRMVWPGAPQSFEFFIGLPLVTALLCGAGIVLALRRREPAIWRLLAAALAISVAILLNIEGWTPWYFIYRIVPGASAVRVVARDMLVLACPATLLAVYALSCWAHRLPVVLTALMAGLLIAEQINLGRIDQLPRRTELQFLAALPPVPTVCKVFAVSTPRPVNQAIATPDLWPYIPNIDGMLIAELIHVPTVNGHASFLPADFRFADPDPETLPARMRTFATLHGLIDGMCGLDLERMAWVPPPFSIQPLKLGAPVLLRAPDANAGGAMLRGWSGGEAAGRWTDGPEADLLLVTPLRGQDLVFSIKGLAYRPNGLPNPVEVFVNGSVVAHWQPAEGLQTLRATIPAKLIPPAGDVIVRLVFATPHRPSDVLPAAGQARATDTRMLGLWAESFTIGWAPPD